MIRGLLLVVRLVFILVLVRIVARWLAGAFASRKASRPEPTPAARPLEELVRDRICNTFVPRSRAVLAVVGGHEELFCSTACRDKALLAAPRAS
ncbi:MAG: hypothetical protein ACHQKZ_06465 [Solirubrobacterales bacterium]